MIKIMTIFIGAMTLLVHASGVIACDENSARLVAKTYILSIPILGRENEIIPLIKSNQPYFSRNGKATLCMRSLGAILTANEIANFDSNNGHSAAESFAENLPEGLSHLHGQVDDGIKSYGSDMLTMGQELIWLANVLPSVAQGNYTPYSSTGTDTRTMLRQILPIYLQMCQWEPSSCETLRHMFGQISPQIEQHIYMLARRGVR